MIWVEDEGAVQGNEEMTLRTRNLILLILIGA